METEHELSNDPLGQKLFASRVHKCPEVLGTMMDNPIKRVLNFTPSHCVITGVGSSEAHGRFLNHLMHAYTTTNTEFWPLSVFAGPVKPNRDATLIVFTQGLSHNSLFAIKQRHNFGDLILFTSITEESALKHEEAELLKTLKNEGVHIINFTPDSERGLLVRATGPIAGYLAAIQFIQTHWPGSIPPCSKVDLLETLDKARENANTIQSFALMRERQRGYAFIASWPLTDYIQNLQFKFLEGIFARAPIPFDTLEFAHGGFQQAITDPPALIIFEGNSPREQYLLEKARPLLDITGCLRWRLKASLPTPWDIFYYEMAINYFLIQAMEHYSVNQRRWPGQGQDGSLYKLNTPISAEDSTKEEDNIA